MILHYLRSLTLFNLFCLFAGQYGETCQARRRRLSMALVHRWIPILGAQHADPLALYRAPVTSAKSHGLPNMVALCHTHRPRQFVVAASLTSWARGWILAPVVSLCKDRVAGIGTALSSSQNGHRVNSAGFESRLTGMLHGKK